MSVQQSKPTRIPKLRPQFDVHNHISILLQKREDKTVFHVSRPHNVVHHNIVVITDLTTRDKNVLQATRIAQNPRPRRPLLSIPICAHNSTLFRSLPTGIITFPFHLVRGIDDSEDKKNKRNNFLKAKISMLHITLLKSCVHKLRAILETPL